MPHHAMTTTRSAIGMMGARVSTKREFRFRARLCNETATADEMRASRRARDQALLAATAEESAPLEA